MEKCPKCKFKINIASKKFKFCPECGFAFKEINQKITMRPTTDDGRPIMVISTDVVEREEKKMKKEIPKKEMWGAEHLKELMADPDSKSYIPESAVTYEDDSGMVISHQQIITVKPVKIPDIRKQNKDFIPEGAVTKTTNVEKGNITIQKLSPSGEMTIENVKLDDTNKTHPPTPRPKFSEIIDRKDIGIEEKLNLLKRHAYSEKAIKQWAKKVLNENEV